jgi:hypothetical protein
MTNGHNKFSQDLIKILLKAAENKIYGSVEVYFEGGKVTQITQRIIKKVTDQKGPKKELKQSNPQSLRPSV